MSIRHANVKIVSIRHNPSQPCDVFETRVALRLEGLLIEMLSHGHTFSNSVLVTGIHKKSLKYTITITLFFSALVTNRDKELIYIEFFRSHACANRSIINRLNHTTDAAKHLF